MNSIIEKLKAYEIKESLLKNAYYSLEQFSGNLFYKRKPPQHQGLRLLNLGCGTLIYPGFCNADDFAFKRSLRDQSFKPDWRLDVTRQWNCDECYWDGVFSQHLLEHLTYSQAIFVLTECFRTMKVGATIRIIVPSLNKYLQYISGAIKSDEFDKFPSNAVAISYLTQMHMHKSTWDEETMLMTLSDVGFSKASVVGFNQGNEASLIMDQPGKAWESLYVEAQKL